MYESLSHPPILTFFFDFYFIYIYTQAMYLYVVILFSLLYLIFFSFIFFFLFEHLPSNGYSNLIDRLLILNNFIFIYKFYTLHSFIIILILIVYFFFYLFQVSVYLFWMNFFIVLKYSCKFKTLIIYSM